jgi:hypothetical protein
MITPAALPAGLNFDQRLMDGVVFSIGDGMNTYDDVSPGVGGLGDAITLTAKLATGAAGEIIGWDIHLIDSGFEIDGPLITRSVDIQSQGGVGQTPLDQSAWYLEPTPQWSSGSTDRSGSWS